MNRNIPDHPDIVSAMRTGYPSWSQPQPMCCDNCGDEIGEDDEVYSDHFHECLCKDCLMLLHRKWW